MLSRKDLPDILVEALRSLGGSGAIVQVCQYIWDNYRDSLQNSGDLFYTWQYDIRWAATHLRKKGILRSVIESQSGIWELVEH